MPVDEKLCEESLADIDALVHRHLWERTNPDDALTVASNLVYSAQRIYEMLGHKKLALAQFQGVVQRLEAEIAKGTTPDERKSMH